MSDIPNTVTYAKNHIQPIVQELIQLSPTCALWLTDDTINKLKFSGGNMMNGAGWIIIDGSLRLMKEALGSTEQMAKFFERYTKDWVSFGSLMAELFDCYLRLAIELIDPETCQLNDYGKLKVIIVRSIIINYIVMAFQRGSVIHDRKNLREELFKNWVLYS